MRRTLHKQIVRTTERGFSLLEAMIAVFILLIGITGLMSLFVVAAAKNSGQGEQATRTTEYAQDKMEQLLALNYTDTTSQVVGAATICQTCPGYVSGAGLSNGTTYVDYVTSGGVISGTSTNAAYTRQWKIEPDATNPTNPIKTITVTVTANFSVDIGAGGRSLAPSTTLIAVKQKEQY